MVHTLRGHCKPLYVERASFSCSISWISVTVDAKLPQPIWLNALSSIFATICWSQGPKKKKTPLQKPTAHNIQDSMATVLLVVHHQESHCVPISSLHCFYVPELKRVLRFFITRVSPLLTFSCVSVSHQMKRLNTQQDSLWCCGCCILADFFNRYQHVSHDLLVMSSSCKCVCVTGGGHRREMKH